MDIASLIQTVALYALPVLFAIAFQLCFEHWLAATDRTPSIVAPLAVLLPARMPATASYALLSLAGHYYVEGVGYAAIQATLTEHLSGSLFLLLLLLLLSHRRHCYSLPAMNHLHLL